MNKTKMRSVFVAGIAGLLLPLVAMADAPSYSVVGTATWPEPSGGFPAMPVASSQYSIYFPAAAVVKGNPAGARWGDGNLGGWSSTAGVSANNPAWLQIDLGYGNHTISSTTVNTVQDNWSNPIYPVEGAGSAQPTTFTQYGIQDYKVQYWNGSVWNDIFSVSDNNHVRSTMYFSPVQNVRYVRLMITKAVDGIARVTSFEVRNSDTGTRDLAYAVPPVTTSGEGFAVATLAEAQALQAYQQNEAAIVAVERGGVGPTQTYAIVPNATTITTEQPAYAGPVVDYSGAPVAFNARARATAVTMITGIVSGFNLLAPWPGPYYSYSEVARPGTYTTGSYYEIGSGHTAEQALAGWNAAIEDNMIVRQIDALSFETRIIFGVANITSAATTGLLLGDAIVFLADQTPPPGSPPYIIPNSPAAWFYQISTLIGEGAGVISNNVSFLFSAGSSAGGGLRSGGASSGGMIRLYPTK